VLFSGNIVLGIFIKLALILLLSFAKA